MSPVIVERGDSPVVLGMPHGGTHIPESLSSRLNAAGRAVADTDWWIDRLYAGLLEGATTVRATFSRYVIDANRDPSGASLYPGQNTTGVCPTITFDGEPIYAQGEAPDEAEIAERVSLYHAPYHDALANEIARVQAMHGIAVLYDCHSIRSEIPYLFEGRLPTFNIGSNGGETCAPVIETIATQVCAAASGFDYVLNGRFRGGWTTRRYGNPAAGVHAVQMELAQYAYMEEAPPWTYHPVRAERVRRPLRRLLSEIERAALDGQLTTHREETNNV